MLGVKIMKKLSILLLVLSMVGLVVGALLYKTNGVLATILLVTSVILIFAYAIIEDRAKKKEKNDFLIQSKKNELESNKNLELHAADDHVTTVIYKLFKGELVELSDLIKNSDCFIEYTYDEEEQVYMVDISSTDLSKKNKDAFIIVLYSSKEEQKLIVNDSEEDLSDLGENEIIDKLTFVVNEKVKKIDVDEFVIKQSKKQLIAFSIICSISVIGIVTFIVLGAMATIEWNVSIGMLLTFSLLSVLTGLGIYSYFREKLIYKNHIIQYTGLFRKPVSCRIDDVKSVLVELRGSTRIIQFLDENDNLLMKTYDNGTIITNKLFLVLLNKNNIKYDLFI